MIGDSTNRTRRQKDDAPTPRVRLHGAAEKKTNAMKARTWNGDAENARHEIAGHENAAPECKGGKCET